MRGDGLAKEYFNVTKVGAAAMIRLAKKLIEDDNNSPFYIVSCEISYKVYSLFNQALHLFVILHVVLEFSIITLPVRKMSFIYIKHDNVHLLYLSVLSAYI